MQWLRWSFQRVYKTKGVKDFLSMKQNQTPREYFELNGFEVRIGKFYNYNSTIEPDKMEIRILHKIDEDIEQFDSLVSKLKEWLQ